MDIKLSDDIFATAVSMNIFFAAPSRVLSVLSRKSKLLKTAEILAVHDVVVQKLINKARDDLGELTSQKSYF